MQTPPPSPSNLTHYGIIKKKKKQAATLASITLIQTWIYPRARGQRLSVGNHYLIIITFVVFAMNVFSVFVGRESAIDLLYLLSYFKLYVSVAKYIPQVSFISVSPTPFVQVNEATPECETDRSISPHN